MNRDAPATPEPTRGTLISGPAAVVGVIAFLAGVLLMAAVAYFEGGMWQPAALPQPVTRAPAADPAPARALPPGTDLATLSAREQILAGRLDQLEARLGQANAGARTAAQYATRAEALLTAIAVRRAIERGLPLSPSLEAQLRLHFGESRPEAVATIIRVSREPVTREDLGLALDSIAPLLVAGGDSESWWTRLRRMVSDLVVLRQSGTPSPRAADRLRRVRRALDEGQVEAALAEVTHMPGAADAQSWITAARRYIAGREALNEVERTALEAPVLPAAPAPAPAPTQE